MKTRRVTINGSGVRRYVRDVHGVAFTEAGLDVLEDRVQRLIDEAVERIRREPARGATPRIGRRDMTGRPTGC